MDFKATSERALRTMYIVYFPKRQFVIQSLFSLSFKTEARDIFLYKNIVQYVWTKF